MSAIEDKQQAFSGTNVCNWRAEEIVKSLAFREEYAKRPNVITAEEMPWERSPDGLIKHLIHRNMNTPELCVEAYMLFLKEGERSGKHRHMWEELAFVVEGEGYDLHWDMSYQCDEEYHWKWAETPKRYDWKRGDFVFIPPFTIHQHWNASATNEARVIVISNRIVKKMGFDWLDQVEPAPKP
jgi:quercetin dioxygenase-like cupin family protein